MENCKYCNCSSDNLSKSNKLDGIPFCLIYKKIKYLK